MNFVVKFISGTIYEIKQLECKGERNCVYLPQQVTIECWN